MHRELYKADDRVPRAPYARLWALAVVLFLALAAGLEGFWRMQEFTPSVTDDEALWAYHRARVDNAPPQTLVVLGRSRIQQAFVPEVFQKACPGWEYVQLAVGGKHPIGALRDIADATEFAGVVLCSITAASLLPELWEQQAGYLDFYYQKWGPLRRNARLIKTKLQRHLACMLPELLPQRVGPDLLRGAVPPQFLWTAPDRCQTVDYRKVDIDEFTQIQLQKITNNTQNYTSLDGYAAWPAGLARIEDMIERIQDRGGHVVFLRAPTSGDYREVERRHFPRTRFWDVFAQQSSALTLHFEDIPVMRDMVCAEGTHLHLEDTGVFTRLLVRELQQAGVLPAREQTAWR